ncbi:MAG: hypothetical protein AAB434_05705 [Planctomycetota bacterium]
MQRIVLAVFLASTPVLATTVVKLDLSEVVHQSDRASLATVVSVRSEWSASESRAYTTVTFRVERDLIGPLPNPEFTLRLLGGVAQRPDGEVMRQVVHGMPEFQVGERTIVFSVNDARLYCPVVGWYQGCYRVRLDPETGEDRVYDNDGLPVTSLSTRDVKVSAEGRAVTLAAFLSKVGELRALPVEERTTPPTYVERIQHPEGKVVLPAGGHEESRHTSDEGPAWPLGLAAALVALGVILGIRRK